MRLDAVLGLVFPEHGIRARRRLWEWCRITVNGKAAKPGAVARAGDTVEVVPLSSGGERVDGFSDRAVTLEALAGELAVLCKPSGLHSAALAGGREVSLESLLPRLWNDLVRRYAATRGASPEALPPVPKLLTRLDRETSGLLLGAFSEEAAARFRLAEKSGKATKTYLAVLSGRLTEPLCIDRALDTADRARTRVRAHSDPDPVRATSAEPLCFTEPPQPAGRTARSPEDFRFVPRDSGSLTLARVTIRRGARHQIRAHLASAGYPLFGDALYSPDGAVPPGAPPAFFLHHTELCLPELRVRVLPAWAPEGVEEHIG